MAIAVMLRDLVGVPEEVPRNWISIRLDDAVDAAIIRECRYCGVSLIGFVKLKGV